MKLKKYSLVMVSILMLLGACFTAAATSVTDPTNDVWHWSNTGTVWSWVGNVADRPNVDITQISYEVNGDKITLEMVVAGSIQTSDKIGYYLWYNSTDSQYSLIYANGTGAAYGINGGNFMNSSFAQNVTISGNTLSAVLDVVGDTSQVELWGWAYEYTNAQNQATNEWWGDWAPNDKFPYEQTDISDNTSGTNTTGDTTGTNGSSTGNQSGSGSTPGFEVILVLGAVATALILLRKRR
jgi:hypothetical protein